MSLAAPIPGTARASRQLELSPRAALAAGLFLGAVVVAVFWDWFSLQVRSALDKPADWGHTLVIPFISGWFVWNSRKELAAMSFRPSWTGLLVLLLGMGWYSACLLGPAAIQHHNLRGLGVAVAIPGVCITILGWRSMRYLWFPLAYWAAFGQTVSEQLLQKVTLRLQDIAAQGAYFLLTIFGFDTDISGNVLTVYRDGVPHPLNVAEACSGMRMLVAFLALAVAMAAYGLPKLWQRVALFVMSVPVALAVNVLRVATLGMLSLADMNFTEGEFHHFVGMVWLIPGFLMFLGVQWILAVLGEPWFQASPRKGAANEV
ncbi:MAG: exosortase/archaeosortase family protein [Phycisphaerales bacterium]